MLSSPTAISASISSSALANTSLTLMRMPDSFFFRCKPHSQVPSESLMKLEPDSGILGFPSFPVGWSRFWLFFSIDNSTAIICLVYPWGIFTAYRLKFMTADQVSHTLMSPRILGIINDMKQCFIYVIILKSSMFRQNFARSTVPR